MFLGKKIVSWFHGWKIIPLSEIRNSDIKVDNKYVHFSFFLTKTWTLLVNYLVMEKFNGN